MLIIEQNAQNELVATLKEAQCVCSSIYLLQFVNMLTNANYFTIATDQSPSPCRYQLFCVTDTGNTTPNPAEAQVSLPLKGQYHYFIYANPDSVLDPTGLNLCEIGKLLVTGTEVPVTAYQSTVNPNQYAYINQDLNS
jgi:hypothetical protein